MHVKLVKYDNEAIIAEAAGISHLNTNPNLNLIDKLYYWKHLEPFEFVNFVWYLEIPLFVERQLLRHRHSSRVEMSMRYVTLEGDLENMYIPEYLSEPKQMAIKQAYWTALEAYHKLIKAGVKPETARTVIPLGYMTKMYVRMNARAFDNFLRLRTDTHAQKEIRELAYLMLDTLNTDGLQHLYHLFTEAYGKE